MNAIALFLILCLLLSARDEAVCNSTLADTAAWISIIAVSALLIGHCVP